MTAPGDDPNDPTRWSSRYYRADCPDLTITMKTDGPDDRSDPPADTTQVCLLDGHEPHLLVRISPDEWRTLTEDEDGDSTLRLRIPAADSDDD